MNLTKVREMQDSDLLRERLLSICKPHVPNVTQCENLVERLLDQCLDYADNERQSGWDDGHDAGMAEAESLNDRYTEGYQDGYDEGYYRGYDEGCYDSEEP